MTDPLETYLDLWYPGWRDDTDAGDGLFWQGFDEWVLLGEASKYQGVLDL